MTEEDSCYSSVGSDDPMDDDWLSRSLKEQIGEKKLDGNWSAIDSATDNGSPTPFTIVTWNVWFSLHEWQVRLEALLVESLQHDPDVLCFQEITTNVHSIMLQCDYLCELYHPTEERLRHGYDCTIWIKKDRFKLFSTTTIPLDSIYGRRGLLADLEMITGGKSSTQTKPNLRIRVVTTHLESGKGMGSTRIMQLKTLFPSIQSVPWLYGERTPSNHAPAQASSHTNVDAAFLVGDFNLDPNNNPEENSLVDSNGIDLWKLLRKEEHGYTENTYQNRMRYLAHGPKHKQVRYDRIIMINNEKTIGGTDAVPKTPVAAKIDGATDSTACKNVPQCIELLGTLPFDKAQSIWPSDHFGLVATVGIEISNENQSSGKL